MLSLYIAIYSAVVLYVWLQVDRLQRELAGAREDGINAQRAAIDATAREWTAKLEDQAQKHKAQLEKKVRCCTVRPFAAFSCIN